MILNQQFSLKFIALSFISACLLALTSSAYAAKPKSGPPWYEIEVIIFLNQLELGVASEAWEVDGPLSSNNIPIRLSLPGELGPEINAAGFVNNADDMNDYSDDMMLDRASIGTSPPNKQAYILLGKAQFQLNNIYNKLKNSANYKPILHIAWRQPTLSPSKSQAIYVFNGMNQPDPIIKASARNQFSESAVFGRNTTENMSQAFEGPQMQQFSGTIRVSVSRYLHIETDLHFREPIWLQETVEVVDNNSDSNISSFFGVQPTNTTSMVIEREVLTDFRLVETRRMRSTEIHYYDHPKFGVIVMATPYAIESDMIDSNASTSNIAN